MDFSHIEFGVVCIHSAIVECMHNIRSGVNNILDPDTTVSWLPIN